MKLLLNRRDSRIVVFNEDTASEVGSLSQDEAVELATKLLDLAGQIRGNGDDE